MAAVRFLTRRGFSHISRDWPHPVLDGHLTTRRFDMTDRSRTRLAMALGVLALGACATTATVNQASEEQAIRAAARDYQAAFNARDVDRLLALHAPDAVLMVSNSPLATGSTE